MANLQNLSLKQRAVMGVSLGLAVLSYFIPQPHQSHSSPDLSPTLDSPHPATGLPVRPPSPTSPDTDSDPSRDGTLAATSARQDQAPKVSGPWLELLPQAVGTHPTGADTVEMDSAHSLLYMPISQSGLNP